MGLALNSKIRFKSTLRGIYFVPNILGGLIVGYIFSFIFTYIIPAVGETFNIEWIQNSRRFDSRCMAGGCYEYDYLYFRLADHSRGCV